MTFMCLRLCALPRPAHHRPRSACKFHQSLIIPKTFGTTGSCYLCSQITGGVENPVPLHVDIPRTGEGGSDLFSEDALQ